MQLPLNPLPTALLTACTPAPESIVGLHSVYYDAAGQSVSDASYISSDGAGGALAYYENDEGGGIVVNMPAVMDKACMKDSEATFSPDTGRPVLIIKFKHNCVKTLEAFTQDNIGKEIALIIDGQLISTPRVHAPIRGGTIMIEGQFNKL